MKKKFAIFIDTQVDFMLPSGALYVEGAQDLIGRLNDFAFKLNKEDYEGVLFTFDSHTSNQYYNSIESTQFPIHCIKTTTGWENIINHNIVLFRIKTYSLEKRVFNMWAEEDAFLEGFEEDIDRDIFFENLKNSGVDTVVLVGVAADFCVKWAIEGLLERGFKVEIPSDLTVGIYRQIDQVVEEDFPNNPNISII